MTLQYQPSAAGISWLTMCENLSNRMQMEQEFLAISATTTGIQAELTTLSSTQTLAELNDQANGLQQQANMQIAGAAVGIVTSLGTFSLGLGLSKNSSTNTNESSVTVEQKQNAPVASPPLNQDGTPISATVDVQPSPNPDVKGTGTPAATNAASQEQTMSLHAKMLLEHGTTIGGMLQSGMNAGGQSLQAQATAKQAQDKALEVEAQGIASVMNSQQQMTAANINSCDTFYNNAEGNFTTVIQVSAVRG